MCILSQLKKYFEDLRLGFSQNMQHASVGKAAVLILSIWWFNINKIFG